MGQEAEGRRQEAGGQRAEGWMGGWVDGWMSGWVDGPIAY
jgi:hypothetical protein